MGAAILIVLTLAACNKATLSTETIGEEIGKNVKKQVVARYNDKEITLQEIDEAISQDIYDLRRKNLESIIVQALVKTAAEKKGKSEREYIQSIANSVEDPSEEELREIYQKNKTSFGDQSFKEIKSMLANRVKQKKRQQTVMDHIEELKKKANVRIQLQQPRIAVEAVGPSKGPAAAPITIVEFSDFECPYCSQACEVADEVVGAYNGKVRLVYQSFPLQRHKDAAKAAEAGLCAETQGKFWEMHDWMFANQDKLSIEGLKKAAADLGMDIEKFNSCLDSGEQTAKVEANVQTALEAGVRGTPTFFVNGKRLTGDLSLDQFKEIIDEELANQETVN
jgi:protein-disulfide isomerase